MKLNRITIIGAGNGGQAIAGFCASQGVSVCLYNRQTSSLPKIRKSKTITLKGVIECVGKIDMLTDDIETAVKYSRVIFIVTTATAHRDLAIKMLPFLSDGQIVVLSPGRTCGVVEFNTILSQRPFLDIYLAETQTLLYACRLIKDGVVNVIGVKDKVMLAGRNIVETEFVISFLNDLFPSFTAARSYLETSLENIGAILHPPVILFNAATIERSSSFYFYRDMTPQVSFFIEKLDSERIEIGKAFNIQLMSVSDWIVYAYPKTKGTTLCDRMRNNPAYYDILGPGSIFVRQLTEDIPTGLVPMSQLARLCGVKTPLIDSVILLSSALLGINFTEQGRTLESLGLVKEDKNSLLK